MTATEAWISNQSKGVRFRDCCVVWGGNFLDGMSVFFLYICGHISENKVTFA